MTAKKMRAEYLTAIQNKIMDNHKYLIALDRDTGYCTIIPEEVTIERIPFGHHILPYVGNYEQISNLVYRFNNNPHLTQKYVDL